MFGVLVYYPGFWNVRSFDHPRLLSLVESCQSHTVVTNRDIYQISELFPSMIQHDVTDSLCSISSVVVEANALTIC